MDKKRGSKRDFGGLEPSNNYLDKLSDFAALLGTIDKAEKAADELSRETGKTVAAGTNPPVAQSKVEEDKPEPTLEELLAELDSLVGLEDIKKSVRSLINLVKVQGLRQKAELSVPPMSLHMVYAGNPGTGKTTVARIMGGLFRAIGVLEKGHLIETDRSGLVAGYVGQTAIKTREVVTSALGGILFIDEAYALAPAKAENDFGREGIETLLKMMEDNRDNLVVIVAGYEGLMERFINSNPGLKSRFNRYFYFPDYKGEELYAIFEGLCKRHEYNLHETAADFAAEHFKTLYDNRGENFGNARDVRNLFEDIVALHADRVSRLEEPTREDLAALILEDVKAAAEKRKE